VTARQDALAEVVNLITRHGLTVADVSEALAEQGGYATQQTSSTVSRIFVYLGGTFVFVGLGIFVGMRWDDLGPAGRVLLTFGPGLCLFVLALVCTADARLETAATPLFLVAGLVQPTGILVMLREYGRGGDVEHAVLFTSVVMLVQHGCTFWARRRTALAFTSVVFGSIAVFTALDLLDADLYLTGITMGASLLCIGWSLDRSPHRAIAGLVYFVGAALLLEETYSWLRREPLEILFLGAACGVVVLAAVARSRSLLVVGTAALVGYIADFIYRHFADNLGAPLALMAMGLVFLGIGAAAVRINTQYIAGKPPARPDTIEGPL
jgi:hypothetical protein